MVQSSQRKGVGERANLNHETTLLHTQRDLLNLHSAQLHTVFHVYEEQI